MKMPTICLIGYGLIGKTIDHFLRNLGYEVYAADKRFASEHKNYPDLDTIEGLKSVINGHEIVVDATPYTSNLLIAHAAAQCGAAYFNLTEDVDNTSTIEVYSKLPQYRDKALFVPQCGLAPGAIGIIGNDLTRDFQEVNYLRMYVGALPKTASNHLKYYLSWSPEGLVNEYYNPCPAIYEGKEQDLQPLEGFRHVTLDGVEYEAFNTSGGIGSLSSLESFGKPIKNVTYQTLRYKGHRDRILFLKEDLGLRKEQMVELFKRGVPHNEEDIVIVFAEASGVMYGQHRRKAYFKRLGGMPDLGFSAIQVTTAAGLVSAVEAYDKRRGDFKLTRTGFFPIERLSLDAFTANKYGEIFA